LFESPYFHRIMLATPLPKEQVNSVIGLRWLVSRGGGKKSAKAHSIQ
jgi:hypothetical protein